MDGFERVLLDFPAARHVLDMAVRLTGAEVNDLELEVDPERLLVRCAPTSGFGSLSVVVPVSVLQAAEYWSLAQKSGTFRCDGVAARPISLIVWENDQWRRKEPGIAR